MLHGTAAIVQHNTAVLLCYTARQCDVIGTVGQGSAGIGTGGQGRAGEGRGGIEQSRAVQGRGGSCSQGRYFTRRRCEG